MAPLDDVNLRTAMHMAVDKETIVTNLYSGLKTVANSILSTDLPYCGGVSEFTPEYNKDDAIKLLESSGYVDSDGDGFREFNGEKLTFQITYPSNGAYDKIVLAFQGYMKEIGIEITTNPIDLMTFFQTIFAGGEYEMTAYITYWVPYDPYTIIANMYPSMVYALATMDIEEAKALIAGIYNTDDTKVVEEIYTKALNCANNSSVVIPISYINDYAVYNSSVVKEYEFNSIPNHVDIEAISLK